MQTRYPKQNSPKDFECNLCETYQNYKANVIRFYNDFYSANLRSLENKNELIVLDCFSGISTRNILLDEIFIILQTQCCGTGFVALNFLELNLQITSFGCVLKILPVAVFIMLNLNWQGADPELANSKHHISLKKLLAVLDMISKTPETIIPMGTLNTWKFLVLASNFVIIGRAFSFVIKAFRMCLIEPKLMKTHISTVVFDWTFSKESKFSEKKFTSSLQKLT